MSSALTVAAGRGGRLFVGRHEGFVLEDFVSGAMLRKVPLASWRASFRRRGRELARRGVPYVVLIAPDAPSVYADRLADAPANFRPFGERFLEAMGPIEGVHFVYPRAALCQARGGLEVYPRSESHWSSYGALVATRVLIGTLAALRPDIAWRQPYPTFTFRRCYGDLGAASEPEISHEFPIPVYAGPDLVRVLDTAGPERQTALETSMPGGAGRVLAFRDSFMTEMAPHFARGTGNLRMYGSTSRVLLDAVDEWRPDIVVSEIAERRLIDYQTDHILERHDALYLTDYGSAGGKIVLRALNTWRTALPAAAAMVAAHPHAWRENAMFAFHAARLLEAAGDPAAAAAHLSMACADQPRHPAFLALRARLALAGGDAEAATADARAAVDQAPWNGYYAELAIYALIVARRADAAAVLLETILPRIDDNANLWYWASVLRQDQGQPAAARDAIAVARDLRPDDTAYGDQAAKLAA